MSALADYVMRRIRARQLMAQSAPAGWLERNLLPCRLVGVSLIVALFAYGTAWWYNTDVRELDVIAAAKSKVEQEFQRRGDLGPTLAEMAGNCARHERQLFQHVSDMRAQFESLEALAGAGQSPRVPQMEQAFLRLMALAEHYPDLKAGQCYRDLADMAETTENRIADSMNEYIEAVAEFNRCNQCFWCNYFTYPVAAFAPLPAYFEYYHTDQERAPLAPRR